MKQLGSLVLQKSMQWTDRYEWSPVSMEDARTLGGRQVVWNRPLIGGRPVTLLAEKGVTWLTPTEVAVIRQMASTAGATYGFIWENESFSVRFDHRQGQAVAIHPLRTHDNQYFIGTIKLLQV